MSDVRSFPIGTLVNVARIEGVFRNREESLEFVRFMLTDSALKGDFLSCHMAECRALLVEQHPWLANILETEVPYQEREAWIQRLADTYGEMQEVRSVEKTRTRARQLDQLWIPDVLEWRMDEDDYDDVDD